MLKSPILTISLIIPVIIFELLYDGIDIWLVNLFLYTSDIVSCTDSYMLLKWLFCLSILACLSTSEVVSTTDSYMFIENVVIYTIYIYIYIPPPPYLVGNTFLEYLFDISCPYFANLLESLVLKIAFPPKRALYQIDIQDVSFLVEFYH